MLPFQIKGVPSSFSNYSLQNWLAFTDIHAQVLSICKFNSRCSISLFSSWSDKAWTVFHLITSFVGCIEAPNLNLFQSNGNTQLITWPFFLFFLFPLLESGIWKEMRRPILFYVLLEWVCAGILMRLLRLCFTTLHHYHP